MTNEYLSVQSLRLRENVRTTTTGVVTRLLVTVGSLLLCVSVWAEDDALWLMCDSCQTDAQFQAAAINVPDPWAWVYVTNRESNQTRLFERFTTWEDLGPPQGLVRMTHVVEKPLSPAVKSVFQQAVRQVNSFYARIPRDEIGAFNNSTAGSVIDDFSRTRIPNGLVIALQSVLAARGYYPTKESINSSLTFNIPKIGSIGLDNSPSARTVPLQIVIEYEDGSTLSVTLNPDGSLTNWEARDVDNNIIEFDENRNIMSVGAGFDGSGIRFGWSGYVPTSAANDFIAQMAISYRLDCRMIDHGSEGIEVQCTRR